MADRKELDAPENAGWRGFKNKAVSESIKNLRFRIPIRNLDQGFFAHVMAPGIILGGATLLGTVLIDGNAEEQYSQSLAQLESEASLSTDITQEGGYQIVNASGDWTPTIMALKDGEEFKIFLAEKDPESEDRKKLVYVADSEKAYSYARAAYAELSAELAARKGENDERLDSHSEVFEIGGLSEAFKLSNADGSERYATGWQHVSEGLISVEDLETLANNWKVIQASISDGGYPEADFTSDGGTVVTSLMEAHDSVDRKVGLAVLLGYFGIAIGGGVTSAAMSASGVSGRRKQRNKNRSARPS